MKKNKVIAVALVVLMMVGALLLVSCAGCPGDGNCKYDATTGELSYCAKGTTDQDEAEKMAQCGLDIVAGKDCTC